MAGYRSRKSPRPAVLGGGYPKVRGVGRIAPKPNVSKSIDWASGETAKAQADSALSPEVQFAIEQAQQGNDSILLPYAPTPSINPPRPRTLAAGYDSKAKTLRIRFREGAGYEYYNVPSRVWQNFKRVKSPGRFINRVLNNYEYARADW